MKKTFLLLFAFCMLAMPSKAQGLTFLVTGGYFGSSDNSNTVNNIDYGGYTTLALILPVNLSTRWTLNLGVGGMRAYAYTPESPRLNSESTNSLLLIEPRYNFYNNKNWHLFISCEANYVMSSYGYMVKKVGPTNDSFSYSDTGGYYNEGFGFSPKIGDRDDNFYWALGYSYHYTSHAEGYAINSLVVEIGLTIL